MDERGKGRMILKRREVRKIIIKGELVSCPVGGWRETGTEGEN